jgi:hypothetical protein
MGFSQTAGAGMKSVMRPPDRHAPARVTVLLLAVNALGAASLGAQQTHLLMVVGLSGGATYKERFQGWASSIRDAAVDRLGIPEANFVWLAEDPAAAPGQIKDRATVSSIRAALTDIAQRAGDADRLVVLLIGHGTERAGKPLFNLVGPDLSPTDLDLMLDQIAPRRVAVVNAGSASGAFITALSGPGRTIITATRSGRESNETWFAGFFAEALSDDGADLDKDGRISLLEAFEYARQEVARYFVENQLLATEHALLDDDGDGRGTREPGPNTKDGLLAGTFYVGGSTTEVAVRAAASDDPVLQKLIQERAQMEEQIAALMARKSEMETAAYELELEAFLVELALKSRELREHGSGG